jgi:threonylcarbamoyladenosine tRNA methylthiotransferase MtaB
LPDVASRAATPPGTVRLIALGCRVNRSDGDAMLAGLGPGFVAAGNDTPADFVVVNTCTVTADGDATARQAIRRAARENPAASIVVTGCYAQVAGSEVADLPQVVAVVGARDHAAVPELLRRLRAGEDPRHALPRALAGAPCWTPPFTETERTRAFLKVQDGCDARCSYCIIPTARGPGRSLPFEDTLSRIAALGAGHAEVVLAGIHLGTYGRDLQPRESLAGLVEAAAERGLVRRLRLSSIEPLEFPLALLGGPARALLCEHFHVPLQSGSARVLAGMRRPYRAQRYREVIEAIAAAVPGACIGADVMSGFPGEGDADHRETVRLLESLPIAYLHVFSYSPRPGTDAAGMGGRVPPARVGERARELLALSDRRWNGFLAAQAGRTAEVVVERVGEHRASGTARQFLSVELPAAGFRRGDVATVRISGTAGGACLGEPVGFADAGGATEGRLRASGRVERRLPVTG